MKWTHLAAALALTAVPGQAEDAPERTAFVFKIDGMKRVNGAL